LDDSVPASSSPRIDAYDSHGRRIGPGSDGAAYRQTVSAGDPLEHPLRDEALAQGRSLTFQRRQA